MSEVPVQDFFEIASHKVTLPRHNVWVHSQSKCVQIESILIKLKVKNFTMCPNNPAKIYGRVKLQNVAKAFLQNIEVKNVSLRDI